jgi:MFS family permease
MQKAPPLRTRLASLDRTVLLLGCVSLLTDLSSEMIWPLLPLFITTVLGAPPAVLGLIEGLAEATANLMKAGSGLWSDRVRKRRPFVVGGYALSGLVKPLFALATVWPHILAVRLADRVGKGLRGSARDAMVASCAGPCDLGLAFGYRKAMDSLGAMLGPVVVFLMLPTLVGMYGETGAYRAVFALSIVPALMAVALVWQLRDTPDESLPSKVSRPELSALPGPYRRNLAAHGLFSVSLFPFAFLVLAAMDQGIKLRYIPLIYAWYNLVYAATAVPAGALSDRFGRRPVVLGGYLLFTMTALGLGRASSPIHLVVLFAAYGTVMAVMGTVQRALVAELVPEEVKATAFGVHQATAGVCALSAGVITGLLWEVPVAGMRGSYVFSAGVSFTAALLFSMLVGPGPVIPALEEE